MNMILVNKTSIKDTIILIVVSVTYLKISLSIDHQILYYDI